MAQINWSYYLSEADDFYRLLTGSRSGARVNIMTHGLLTGSS